MKKGIIAILIIIALGFIYLNYTKWQRSFQSDKWISWVESEEESRLRWEMIGSLKLKHRLKGKTQSEIIELLGRPTRDFVNSWSYYLGMTGFGINAGSLILTFKEDICVNYEVLEH